MHQTVSDIAKVVATEVIDLYNTASMVSRQLVYGHFVYHTSSTDISSTDIWYSMTFLAEIEAGMMKWMLYQQKLD